MRPQLAIFALGLLAGCAAPTAAPPAADLYARGVESLQRGERETALQRLEEAVEANPRLTMARSTLGDLYRADGEYRKASRQYEAVVRLDPYGYEGHYALGVCYQLLNRANEAIACYLRALELQPRDARTNMNLGVVHLTLGHVDDALPYLERATLLDPRSADAWANLGVALDAKGKLDRAELAYRKSLELKTDAPAALLNYGVNLTRQGKITQAITVLELAAADGNLPIAHKRLGDALALAGRHGEAQQQYADCLKLHPTYYPAMNELGRSLIKQYQNELELDRAKRYAALAWWRRSLGIRPDQPAVEELVRRWANPPLFAPN